MMTEDDTEMKWRDLALQFDGHRMQAISFLKMILSELPDDQYAAARDFIKSGPLSGEEVLRNRIAALTQPVSPALKLPWSENTCRECGSKSLSWDFAIINKSTVQNGLLRISDVDGLFYLGCDECSETMTQASPDEVVELLSALQQSINAPHTAPIEPICATGGAEWVSDERFRQLSKLETMHEVSSIAKELLAQRKAFSEPVAWVNRTDVEQFEPHILAKRSKSLACTLPLYRKPIDSAT